MEKGYKILSATHLGKKVVESDLKAVYAEISKLASNPTPDNRYQIAQLFAWSVKDILDTKVNWLENIADTKDGSVGEKPEFDVAYTGVVAKVQAKGGTPDISMVFGKKTVLATDEIAVRPKINFQELVQTPEKLLRLIEETALKMENVMVQNIEGVLYTAFSALSTPNYASGGGVIKATFDPVLQMVQRFGQASIFGDITQLAQFTALTGYSNRVAEKYMVEGNENRFIGIYNGANMVELSNRFVDETALTEDNLVLRDDLVYVLSTGDKASRPLKVFVGGQVRIMEDTNIEDESYEMLMRLEFGAGVIGNQKRMGMYEDTNE